MNNNNENKIKRFLFVALVCTIIIISMTACGPNAYESCMKDCLNYKTECGKVFRSCFTDERTYCHNECTGNTIQRSE